MTDEEKAATAEAEKQKADAEFEASMANFSEEEKTAKRAEKEAQATALKKEQEYEAKFQKEREAREKAEKALADARFKEAERRRKEAEGNGGGEDDDAKTLTVGEFRKLSAEERRQNQLVIQARDIESIAGELTSSAAERSLVIEIHRNRTFPPHLTLREQLEEALVIANKDKLVGERNEALRALRGREAANKDAAGTYRDAPVRVSKPAMAPQDRQAIESAGFVLNQKTGQYEKKLPNGRVLVRDSKTGKVTFLERVR